MDGESILGLDLGAIDSAVQTYIVLYTDSSAYKVNVNAVTLAIDEFSDMDYFKAKGTITVKSYVATFEEGDFEHNGYYVLVKDIDAKNASFSPTSAALNSIDASRIDANGAGLTDSEGNFVKGFSGVLDGNGYSFKNFKLGNNGIFPFIVGDAVIKNVGFINCVSTTRNSIAVSLAGNATMQDIYVEASGLSNVYMAHSVTVGSVGENATMKNVMINVSYADSAKYPMGLNTDNRTYAQTASIIGGIASDSLENVYVISNVAIGRYLENNKKSDGVNFDTPLKEWQDTKDAALVDGEANALTNITLYNTIKRYTNAEKMSDDKANNDLSSWNSDIWVIRDGVPTFKGYVGGEYSVIVNDEALSQEGYEIIVGDELQVAIQHDNTACENSYALNVITGDAVTVESNVITATKKGNAVVQVVIGSYKFNINVKVSNPPIDYEKEYQFSNYDGLFFDGANVVTTQSIIDDLTDLGELVAVQDGSGNDLSYNAETGVITGLEFDNGSSWEDLVIVFVGSEEIYRVHVKAAELIIDEAADFEYFSLKQTAGVAGGGNTAYIAPGDMEFDGYYVLAKDINFEKEGYAHDFYNGQVVGWSARGYSTAARYIGTTHGLTGTFDGNGHTITDITFDNTATSGSQFEAGLFGWINGGTIKNTAFVSPDEGDLNGGSIFAWAITDSALFQDCYFYFDTSYGNYGTCQFISSGAVLPTFTRCYMEIKDTNVTYNAAGTFLAGGNFEDSYLVFSHSPFLSGSQSNTKAQASADAAVTNIQTRKRIAADAAYVDGVANAATSDRFYVATRWDSAYYSLADYTITFGTTVYEKGSTYDITLYDGLQRYTSKAKMATVENDFSDWNSSIWTIVEGVPTWKATIDQA